MILQGTTNPSEKGRQKMMRKREKHEQDDVDDGDGHNEVRLGHHLDLGPLLRRPLSESRTAHGHIPGCVHTSRVRRTRRMKEDGQKKSISSTYRDQWDPCPCRRRCRFQGPE